MAGARRLTLAAFVFVGIAAAVAMVALIAPWANANPDGLEKVGADQGIDTGATEHDLAGSPFADYGVEGVDSPVLATGIAGVVGIVATFAVGAGVVWIVRRRRSPSAPPAAAPGG